jgi:hypothetical protein
MIVYPDLPPTFHSDAQPSSFAGFQVRGRGSPDPYLMLKEPLDCSVSLESYLPVYQQGSSVEITAFGPIVGVRYDEHNGSGSKIVEDRSRKLWWCSP